MKRYVYSAEYTIEVIAPDEDTAFEAFSMDTGGTRLFSIDGKLVPVRVDISDQHVTLLYDEEVK